MKRRRIIFPAGRRLGLIVAQAPSVASPILPIIRAVATGDATTNAAYSDDGGLTWTPSTLPFASSARGIAYGSNTYVLSGSRRAYSLDGITWIDNGNIPDYGRVIFGNDIFLETSNNDSNWYTSADGISWVAHNQVYTRTLPSAFGGGIFSTGAQTGLPLRAFRASVDGVNWTTGNAPDNFVAHISARPDPLLFCAVMSGDNSSWTSINGFTYTKHANVVAGGATGMAYGAGLFVAVYGSTTIRYSSDGITWNATASPVSLSAISYSDTFSRFVAVGPSGAHATSADGITWSGGVDAALGTLTAVLAR